MSKLRDFYRQNIYGVMGTLVFHILLVMSFILTEADIKGNVSVRELLIEFPNMLPEEPELITEGQFEGYGETTPQFSGNMNRTTNIASNRLATNNNNYLGQGYNNFFDQEYLAEMEAARQLASNVSNQLSQQNTDISGLEMPVVSTEVINTGSIRNVSNQSSQRTTDVSRLEMPVHSTEGMDPGSIKNVINVGESNIVYYIENRYHISLPIPIYLAQGGGNVIVDISVNRNGRVVKATVRKNSSVQSEQIYLLAEEAASKTVFNASPTAPELQAGTIHYNFIAQ